MWAWRRRTRCSSSVRRKRRNVSVCRVYTKRKVGREAKVAAVAAEVAEAVGVVVAAAVGVVVAAVAAEVVAVAAGVVAAAAAGAVAAAGEEEAAGEGAAAGAAAAAAEGEEEGAEAANLAEGGLAKAEDEEGCAWMRRECIVAKCLDCAEVKLLSMRAMVRSRNKVETDQQIKMEPNSKSFESSLL